MIDSSRGVLFPSRLPSFHRLPPPAGVAHLVMWFWIPEWNLPPGVTSRQDIVAYPALNLVIEPHQVTLSGATTRATHRELSGTGWAVGALLRPAAVAALVESPSALVDGIRTIQAPDLHHAVTEAMVPSAVQVPEPRAASTAEDADGSARRTAAVTAFAAWLAASNVSAADLHANALSEVFLGEEPARTLAEAASRLAVSERTLQRMAHRYVGVTPAAMIRRRRLQEAAERVREDPDADLATLASELGYADHAHLTRDFRVVLGMAPTTYRAGTQGQ